MKNIYYILFVVLYRVFSRFGEKELPQFASISVMSICVGFNITSIITYFEIKYFPTFRYENDFIILLFMYLINYFVFIYKKRYKSILNANIEKITSNKKLCSIIVIFYFLFSLGMWIWLGSIVRALNLGI